MEIVSGTQRNQQFSTRVKKSWLAQLKKIAYEEELKYVEVLTHVNRLLDCYEKSRNECQRIWSEKED